MNSKDIVKLALAIVLLVAAGLYFAYGGREAEDTGDDTKTEWFCTSCNKPFELTAAQVAESMRLQERPTDSPVGPGEAQARGRGAVRTFNIAKCPFCNQWSGEAARKCPECGEIFLARTKEGTAALCPKCGWDQHTGKKGDAGEHEPHPQ